MHAYPIAPRLTKIAMDFELMTLFETLRSTLRWRPLTTNLESCEDGGYLYFRITLRLGAGATYAGFSSGAPFMLTREDNVKKKGFFLRHWVRMDLEEDAESIPLTRPEFVSVAILADTMIVRVDIDREMTLKDTFKSVPFATWMFQVTQIDALIENAPGVRFAFAIERTVTTEERDTIMANVEHTRTQLRIQKAASKSAGQRVAPIRTRPPPFNPQQNPQNVASTPVAPPPSKVSLAQQESVKGKSFEAEQVVKPQPTASKESAPTTRPQLAVSSRNQPTQRSSPAHLAPRIPQQPMVIVPAPTPTPTSRSVQRSAVRSNSSQPRAAANQQSGYPPPNYRAPVYERKLTHPFLKLWEKRPLDDAYEPIFIVDSDEMTERISKSWTVDDLMNPSHQFNYKKLQCLPGADYPSYYWDRSSSVADRGRHEDIVIRYAAKKARVQKENPQSPEKKNDHVSPDGKSPATPADPVNEDENSTSEYVAAVKAAAEYNGNLAVDRAELQNWLLYDEQYGEEEEEGDEDENDSSSSG